MLGLLLVDHGSRRMEANRQLEEMAAHLRRLRPDDLVAIAHLELCPPDIQQAISDLAGRGVDAIHVLPYFLSDGRHSQQDIPRHCQQAAALHPHLAIQVHPVLGPHALLALVLLERSGLTPGGGA